MPKGVHCGSEQTRHYIGECLFLPAKFFKRLTNAAPNQYSINSDQLSEAHRNFKLIETAHYHRVAVFTIKDKKIPVVLQRDDASASNKLYLLCPYCKEKRQGLYAFNAGYACRGCLNLHYPCQSESKQDRLARRIRKLRVKIWGKDWPDVYNLFESSRWWPKPKWMRHKTYESGRHKINVLEAQYFAMLNDQLTRWYGTIGVA